MPSTLLTGANSFVAAHIINALIEAGHHVTGTVRRASSADEIFALHPEWKDHLDIVVVDDFTNQTRWEDLFKTNQFDHVAHVAAPLVDIPGTTDYDTHFYHPNVEGNLSLLRAAHNFGSPSLKSIVVTGSINAATTGSPDELSAGPITSTTWVPISQDEARALKSNAYMSYCSGKKEGEHAIWNFVEQQKPTFSVTVFLPALIFGPPIEPLHGGVKGLHYSAGVIYSLINGTYDKIPDTTFPSYIDVRDLATAHVRALTEERVKNKRLLIGGRKSTYTDLVRALGKAEVLKGRKLPEESGEDLRVTLARIEADEANTILMGGEGGFRSLEVTMRETAERLVELEREG
ncbi:hypothetical protein V8F06_001404 [Rhypophila decipiens]